MTESVDLSHHSDPSSPPSVCPTTPFLPSPPPPSSFSCSPPPFHWAELLSRSFSPLFYLLPLVSPFPRLLSFITTLFLSSPILPRITVLLYGLSRLQCRPLLCLPWFTPKPFSHLSHISSYCKNSLFQPSSWANKLFCPLFSWFPCDT